MHTLTSQSSPPVRNTALSFSQNDLSNKSISHEEKVFMTPRKHMKKGESNTIIEKNVILLSHRSLLSILKMTSRYNDKNF